MQGELLPSVQRIVRQAGEIVVSYYGQQLERVAKPNNGFVTPADRASEAFLMKELRGLLPQASFLAEESGEHGHDDYCWVIDPLDGTTNFANQLPYFAISVALTFKHEPILGVIYVPLQDELFYAIEGGGAFVMQGHDKQQIRVSSVTDLDQALILVGVPYAKDGHFKQIMEKAQAILPHCFAFRHLGAAALDAAMVAAGRADGLFFTNLTWWDIAAGVLLIKEAGGQITDFKGRALVPGYKSCLAGNHGIYTRLKEFF